MGWIKVVRGLYRTEPREGRRPDDYWQIERQGGGWRLSHPAMPCDGNDLFPTMKAALDQVGYEESVAFAVLLESFHPTYGKFNNFRSGK
jgi:hypothetical protein